MKALLMTNNAAVTSFGVSVSPSNLNVSTSNGAYRSPKFTASVVGGVGPFTYLWESSEFIVDTPTEQKTSITASAFNDFAVGSLKCTVTDTGNGNQTKSSSAFIDIEFGTQQ